MVIQKLAVVFRELRLHLGVFALLLGAAYLLVRFTRVPTAVLGAVPPVFLIYLGLYWIVTSARLRRGSPKRRRGTS
jgi:hypothetical protein